MDERPRNKTEKLIREVQSRPLLWDKYHDLHYNREATDREWLDLSLLMNTHSKQFHFTFCFICLEVFVSFVVSKFICQTNSAADRGLCLFITCRHLNFFSAVCSINGQIWRLQCLNPLRATYIKITCQITWGFPDLCNYLGWECVV